MSQLPEDASTTRNGRINPSVVVSFVFACIGVVSWQLTDVTSNSVLDGLTYFAAGPFALLSIVVAVFAILLGSRPRWLAIVDVIAGSVALDYVLLDGCFQFLRYHGAI